MWVWHNPPKGGDSIVNATRLRLDFGLKTAEERRDFIEKYLETLPNPTSDELEMCANYVLWGKTQTGKSIVQEKDVYIETKHKTWSSTEKAESLDALLENPAFNEAHLHALTAAAPRIPKQIFDRKAALENSTGLVRETLERLFREIDEAELTINLYEIAHGKRKTEPRAALLRTFTEDEIEKLRRRASHLTPYSYLKMRHYLVELRQEQYTVRDSFAEQIGMGTVPRYLTPPADSPTFELVRPLGTVPTDSSEARAIIFRDFEELVPANFGDSDLKVISDHYWSIQESDKRAFDFQNLEHVYQFILLMDELEKEEPEIESTMPELIQTFRYYEKAAGLPELQHDILDMKMEHVKNQDIANAINKKYEKHYNANYISTIFRQKIIKSINAAAAYHKEIVENLFFPENFKKCSRCGQTFLKIDKNFVQKKNSRDGYAGRCKMCDKEVRRIKKEKKLNEQKERAEATNGVSASLS